MNFKGNKKQASLLAVGSLLTASLLTFSCAPNKSSEQQFSGETETNSNIVGGVAADANYQSSNGIVGLLITSQNFLGQEQQAICTGTLIDKKIVLTAAHCIAEPGLTSVVVIFAKDMQTATQDRVRFALTGSVHEQFQAEVKPNDPNSSLVNWHDIAMLVLNEDAPADFKPARLAAAGTALKKGGTLTLAGYGITNAVIRKEIKKNGKSIVQELAGVGDGTLRKVDGMVIANMTNNDNEIVLDQKKKGACHGDSGGPAFLKNADGTVLQVGVTSRGLEKLGNCNVQSVYTSTIAHMDWIKATSVELLKQAEEILKKAADQNKAAPAPEMPGTAPQVPVVAGSK